MRCDSIEFGWSQKVAKLQRKAVSIGGTAVRAPRNRQVRPDATDEAFASFEGVADSNKAPSIDRALVTKLAAQLEALDRQREHLATLLGSVAVTSEAAPSAAL